ncbi:glycerate kinase [Streptococcus hillyeri]|uniref:Glycerate kinase n=1 Tax=Streptococcus hillyeri TaxID=2282420 RepID=A0A3L9DUZ4_9STRE|nr:glycerate kinase [Streptococcus hillyeri]RLY04865.1 glycerate kinase [Streptococcus hillyeri]
MGKKIVIASDSFKGSASSKEIGTYIADGIHSLYPDYDTTIFSIADGGEGTVDAILEVNKGHKVTIEVQGPLGNPVEASYGIIDDGKTAVMEMAAASGITLVLTSELDVLKASTYGTGQMIKEAIEKHVERIYIGIGGSATNDGGMGMASALGAKFFDEDGLSLEAKGENLSRIVNLDISELETLVDGVEVIILSDVTNPLCGPNGATAVYGPQKGATPSLIPVLDDGLANFAQVIEKYLKKDVKDLPGAGAAGGLGAGLMAFLNGKTERGIDKILELIHIEEDIATSDLVITGEGRMDGQSINGKAPLGIATIAKRYQVPAVAIVGSCSNDLTEVYDLGISGVFDIINRPMTLDEAMLQTPELVKSVSRNVISLFSFLNK